MLHGLICVEHFKNGDLKKVGDKFQLIPDSVPSIFNTNSQNKDEGVDENIDEGSHPCDLKLHGLSILEVSEYNEASSADIVSSGFVVESSVDKFAITGDCNSCKSKDDLIRKYKEEIMKLRKDLKNVRSKVYYLESTKSKLKSVMLQLKDQSLVDMKLLSSLQVCCFMWLNVPQIRNALLHL